VSGLALGYSITSRFSLGVPGREAAASVLARARVAAESGYDYVEAGDHHATSDTGYIQNVPMAARLAEPFDRVATMVLLPLYHPVLFAEQLGTLDALVNQLDFWCAVGGGAPAFAAFDVPLAERADRFEESLALIRSLWTEEAVTFDGAFHAVEGVSINPTADPRVCIGATAEPAVRRAARLADAWVASAHLPLADIEERLGWLADEGGADLDHIVRRDALVFEDGDAADAEAAERVERGYRGWPADTGRLLTGDAESVAADLATLEHAGTDEVVVRPMADEHAEETLHEVARARELR
jgi:alkanesulfonate monooxygenase SsuD/methylene tetrahydromethanopterin reductase-like flavin-dependent oxidoreductase (luciferase family)